MGENFETIIDRLHEYRHKCDVLKQINSNKSLHYKRINSVQAFLTVVVSGIITFFGFSGTSKIALYLTSLFHIKVSETNIEAVFNVSVFVLFLVTICHLLFRPSDKQAESDKAIWMLTNLINDIDDTCKKSSCPVSEEFLNTISIRYDIITQNIPANTDKEHEKAKKNLLKKANDNGRKFGAIPSLHETDKNKEYFCRITFKENREIQRILSLLQQEGPQYYLAGGVLRNLVWDRVSGYKDDYNTPFDDVDVVYYNSDDISEESDKIIEKRLLEKCPNYNWDVKNQARMHQKNGDEPYCTLEDAVSKWPETASALAIRKDRLGAYHVIAPYGYDDLLRLLIRPTPNFINKREKIYNRISKKNWKSHWPKLEIIEK